MRKEQKEQLIHLINELRNEYCESYNCCFKKDQGYHYERPNLCPLCYNGPSNCMCDDILWRAFHTKLTEKRHPRVTGLSFMDMICMDTERTGGEVKNT